MITKKINGGNFEPVVTGEIVLDAVPTEGSLNSVTSDGVAKAIAEGGGGGSYTAGDGIAISEGEISAKVDGTTIQVNADGELEAIGGGGTSYTAGDGIAISDQNVISVPVDNKTLAVERPTYVYSGVTIYTDTNYLSLGLADLPTVASTSGISAFKLTPQVTTGGLSYTLRYDSETQTGLNVRVQIGNDSSFTKYATSTENAKIGNNPVVLGTTVFNLSDCNAFTPTMGHSSTTFGELFDFTGGDSFEDIFSGSSVYIRLVAWDSANGAVVGAPLTIRTTGYPNMRWAITTNAAAAKMVVKYNTNTLELSHPGNGYLSVKNPNPYPMPASLGTAGQVLTVSSGATGVEWASPSSGGNNVFMATSTTTFPELWQAYHVEGKIVYCEDGSGNPSGPTPYFLQSLKADDSSYTTGVASFVQFNRYSTGRIEAYHAEVSFNYSHPTLGTVNFTRQTIVPDNPQSHVGEFLTAHSNGGMVFASVNQVPASTSADEYKVLTVDSQGTPGWATPSGGSAGYTPVDLQAISAAPFTIPVSNRQDVAVTVSNETGVLTLQLANDCTDAIVKITGRPAYFSSIQVVRGQDTLDLFGTKYISSLTAPTRSDYNILASDLQSDSDWEMPSDFSECTLVGGDLITGVSVESPTSDNLVNKFVIEIKGRSAILHV